MTTRDQTERTTGGASGVGDLPDLAALRFALETAALGGWAWEIEADRLRVSPDLAAAAGVDEAALDHYNAFLDVVHPEDRARLVADVDRAIAERGEQRTVFRVVRPDGEVRWIEGRGRLAGGENGGAAHLIGLTVDVTDRRRAEAALRESDARFRQLTETIESVFWLVDPRDRRVLYVSPAYERLWGLDPERLYADFRVWGEIVHPDDWMRSEQVFVESAGSGRYDQEYRIVLPEGRVRWVHDRGFPVPSETGEVERIVGIAEDVTDRRAAEAALLEREERLRLATEAARLGTWDLDLADWSARLDRQVRGMAGLPTEPADEDAALPRDVWLDLIAAEDRERVVAEVERAIAGDGAFGAEFGVAPAGGAERTMAASGVVERDPAGRARRLYGIVVDVSEERRAAAALRESEERFRATFEQAAVGLAHLDLDGRWLRVNQKLCGIVGYDREELLARTSQEITHELDRDRALALAQRLVAGELPSYRAEQRYVRKDGSLVWVQVTPSFVRPAAAAPYVATVIEDITARKLAGAARERAQAAMRRQAGLLDHAYDAIFAWEWGGAISYWNRGAERLYGYRSEEAVGRSSRDLLRSQYPDAAESVMTTLARDGVWEGEIEHTRRDGRAIFVESRHVLVEEGSRRYVLEVNRDITARRAAAAEREALVEGLETERARLAAVLDQMPSGVVIAEAPSGRLLSGNPQVERIFRHPFLAAETVEGYEGYRGFDADGRPLRPEEWPLARAITTGEVITGEEIDILRGDGSRGTLSLNAAPIRDGGDAIVAGVVTFDDVTERKREAAGQRFLAEASAALASSLDYETTLARVARLAVPQLADLCLVEVADEDGALRRLAVAHVDPIQDARFRETVRRSPNRPSIPGGSSTIAPGEAAIAPPAEEASAAENGHPGESAAAPPEFALGSSLALPMVARGRTLGRLTLAATAESGRAVGEADRPLAEEVARRAAAAIDNARLYAAEGEARRAAERVTERIARLQAVTVALAEALTPDQVAAVVVEQGLAALGADGGALALVAPGAELEVVRAVGYPESMLEPWRRIPLGASVPLAEAVRERRVVVVQSPPELDERYPALAGTGNRPGHRTLVAVPLPADERTVGALGLSFGERRLFGPDDQEYALALGRQAAQALERARLYAAERAAREEAEAARGRLSFLAKASELLAASLDVEATLRRVAGRVVPKLADWCTLHLVAEDDTISQLVVAHADPAKVEWAVRFQERYPADAAAPGGVAEVLRTGRSRLLPRIDAAALSASARDDEHRALLSQVGMESVMLVPLAAHGQRLGVLTLIAAESGRRYGPEDLTFAEDLARRCAVAVANARLYAAERRVRAGAEAAERAARRDAGRLATLARSSAAFAGAGLDFEAALDAVARSTAELTGDACVVRLVSDDGAWSDVAAVHHPDPARFETVRAIVGSHRQSVADGFSAGVLRNGESLLISEVPPERVRAVLPERAWPLLDRYPIRSLLVVPLGARERVIGTLALLRDRPGHPFDDEDRAFLQEVAGRAALAIDNAQLYREAREAVRSRDEFLSIAAHELRTPVTTIKGYAQMLTRARARGHLATNRAGRFLDAIDDSTNRLGVLTNDLLDVSRIRLGQLPLRPQSLDLAELARGFVDRYADRFDSTHCPTLTVRGAPGRVLADPDRTEQILTNLLDNATKYAPAGGEIAVSVEPAEMGPEGEAGAGRSGVLLSVRDEGIGLPVGESEAIFEPFNRATNAARDNLPGMGLGLHICRSIAERHGGRIWAESAGEGHGTTLRLWLPTSEQGAEGGGQDEASPSAPSPLPSAR